jgi:hypothetical protein
LDYKKIFIYLIIIVAALGYWYKSGQDEKKRAERGLKFASVYSATAVMAELYRNEPDRFTRARDSIYTFFEFNADSIQDYKESFDGREEEWNRIWTVIRSKTDSLIDYFKANPVEHQSDSTGEATDST